MTAPTAFFVVGPAGAGKTTLARRLAEENAALPFFIDDWMTQLFAPDLPDLRDFAAIAERVERARGQIWRLCAQTRRLRVHVALDIGLLSRRERDGARAVALAQGWAVEWRLVDSPSDVRSDRIARRNGNRENPPPFSMTRAMFDFVEPMWQSPDAQERAAGVWIDGAA